MPRIYALTQRGTHFVVLCLLAVTSASAQLPVKASPASRLVPDTTRGFVSVPDFREIEASFDKTEIGRLVATPEMKPFFEDLETQINEQVGQTGVRLGINWGQLADVVAGEVAVATIEPQKHTQRHALALIVDVTGRQKEVQNLMQSIAVRMQKRKATPGQRTVRGTKITTYAIPPRRRGLRGFSVSIFVYKHENGSEQLFAVDHPEVADDLLQTAASQVDAGSLSRTVAFRKVMERCNADAGDLAPHAYWYIEPLGYMRVSRAALPNAKPRRNDILSAVEKQGFTALQAIGGVANIATERHEFLVRGMIYAPGDPKLPERFKLAARLLNNAKPVPAAVPTWVPPNVSGYHTASWDITESFGYVGTLVDEIAGEPGFFEDLKASLKEDPNGPQIDIDNQIVAHFGDRITLLTDTVVPIDIDSERVLVSISLEDAKAMEAGINQIMQNDPTAEPHDVAGKTVWLITAPEDEDIPGLDIDDGGLDDLGFDDEDDDESEDPLISIADTALCVHDGNLIVASHIDFIAEILTAQPANQSELEVAQDFKAIMAELARIAPNQQKSCIRSFTRIDDAAFATYELFKDGRLPESKGIIGRVLNRIFEPEEKGALRAQKFDAKKLPSFDKFVRQFLGPAGASIQLDDEGWILSLIVLKPQGRDQVPGAAVSTARASK